MRGGVRISSLLAFLSSKKEFISCQSWTVDCELIQACTCHQYLRPVFFFLSSSFWFDFIVLTNLVTMDLSNLWKVKYSKFLHEFSVEWQNIDVYGICYFSKKRNYHNFCRTGSSAVGTPNFPKLKKIRKDNKLKKRYLRHDLVEYLSGLKIRG